MIQSVKTIKSYSDSISELDTSYSISGTLSEALWRLHTCPLRFGAIQVEECFFNSIHDHFIVEKGDQPATIKFPHESSDSVSGTQRSETWQQLCLDLAINTQLWTPYQIQWHFPVQVSPIGSARRRKRHFRPSVPSPAL